ncbi:hypothetical protein CKO15_00620 [Halorhodospira abdelmalekii]|nr:hypothetical protein [Halorhodospira abdelmalekii]
MQYGAWLAYEYSYAKTAAGERSGGQGYDSLVLALDHRSARSPWSLRGEVRLSTGAISGAAISGADSGPGANTGQSAELWRYLGIKELVVGHQLTDSWRLELGKARVPFTWSRFNFWPGERMASGFGAQYNLGVRLLGGLPGAWESRWMLIHGPGFRDDSQPLDDHTLAHWGSLSEVYGYRKSYTAVGDLGYWLVSSRAADSATRLGVSLQGGRLQDRESGGERRSHWAVAVYSEGRYGRFDLATKAIHYDQGRSLYPVADDGPVPLAWGRPDRFYERGHGRGQIAAVSLGARWADWYPYVDWSSRWPDRASRTGGERTMDLVLGTRYRYGPGQLYLELLLANLNRADDPVADGLYTRPGGGRSEALFISADYYF